MDQRGKSGLLIPGGIPGEWLPTELAFERDAGLSYEAIDRSEGALTGCTVAIASTGTIVLCHSEIEGRRALTLIPDYHLCVVFADQIVARSEERRVGKECRCRGVRGGLKEKEERMNRRVVWR